MSADALPTQAPHPGPPPDGGRGSVVLVDLTPLGFELVREVLEPAGASIEQRAKPWSGDDVEAIISWDPVSAADMDRMPGVKAIVTPSVGFDHIDLVAAANRGVWVCNVPDYCIDEMADSTIALVLALLRGVVALDRTVRAGAWDDHAAGPLARLRGSRLGVVGFGRIGRAVAAHALALGLEVWGTDPIVPPDRLAAAGLKPAALDDLLASCAVVTLHSPLTPETKGLIGERELRLMPRGSFLVNAARGGLVDLDAVMEALESGHLGGAAIDVLAYEPPTPDHPAPRHPHLIVTPHSAWYSPDSERAVYQRAAQAVRAVLEGRRPEGAVAQPLR
jgi:phosphoglycerate dehydrogenase-like enzyme